MDLETPSSTNAEGLKLSLLFNPVQAEKNSRRQWTPSPKLARAAKDASFPRFL